MAIDFKEAPANAPGPVASGFGTPAKLDFQEATPPPAPEAPAAPGVGTQMLQGAGRALDYMGGIARTGIASSASVLQNAAQGKFDDVVTPEDLGNAFKGKAPSSAEYMARMGVPQGPSMELPYLGEISTRGAAGFALDVATDPIGEVSKLAKEVPYIGKLINAPGAAADALGEAVYKSGLKKVDAKLVEKGGAPVSDVLLKNGITGTSAQVEQKAAELSETMRGVRKGLYDKADELGVKVNVKDMKFDEAQKVIDQMKKDPVLAIQAEHLEDMIGKYKGVGEAPIAQVSDWKTNLNDALPQQAFDKNGRALTTANRMKQALAKDFKNAIVDTGNSAEHGLGDAIEKVNSDWGPLLSASDPLAKQAKQAAGGSIGTWVDGLLAGTGHIPALAVKKSMDLANTTYLRTKLGKALIAAGHSGVVNSLVNRTAVDAVKPAATPAPEEPQP